MGRELKVLFVAFPDVGHTNSCISLAQQLIRCGHKAIFATTDRWRGKLEVYGIEEVIYENVEMGQRPHKPPRNRNNNNDLTPVERAKMGGKRGAGRLGYYKKLDPIVEQLIKDIEPDVIVVEGFQAVSAVEVSGIPWVWCYSSAPLMLYDIDDDLPPPSSGLSVHGDKNEWKVYKDARKEGMYESWKEYNDYMVSRGAKPLRKFSYFNGSPYLNVYGFPKELDYSEYNALPENYVRFDNLMRSEDNIPFEIPEQLKDKTGKLIYFSLGTVHGEEVELKNRLLSMLAKSPHRFIVAKGKYPDQIKLADNMWGQEFLPQTQVIKEVDLVITHAGNNTVTETFYFGKPIIALPFGSDQLDNAQQIHDKAFGIRLDSRHCTEEELLNAIESLLNDKQLNEKLKNISKRIQTENSISKFPQLIENLVK